MRAAAAYVLFVFVAIAYFTPSMIALRRMKQKAAKIFLTNLLLGWTITGWLAVLSWAAGSEEADFRSAENSQRWRRALRDSRRARQSRC
jgi:hypothetical protein